MLNSTDIQFLLVIRESASLLATAHKLGLTASAVTQRLQQFERKLGIQLVDRSARQLQFTDEGELLCQRGVGIIDEIPGLMETLHANRHGACQSLRCMPIVTEWSAASPSMPLSASAGSMSHR